MPSSTDPTAAVKALGLQPDELNLLQRFNFNASAFLALQGELKAGRFGPERNRVTDPVTAPKSSDVIPWPTSHSAEGKACHEAGLKAIKAGKVAVAILNGGMATRFGGRVKGVVEVVDDLSFIAIKLRDIAKAAGPVPIFLMNSFATDADTQAHFAAHNYFGIPKDRVHFVHQGISMRLTPEGELFRDSAGKPSFYAPGHGDLLTALAQSKAFQAFVQGGGEYITVSNVDNLGATLEPKVIGAHLRAGRDVTVEVASREGGDTGGAPVWRGGKLEVLEGFRFPKGFSTDTLPVFNTNTFVLGCKAVRDDYNLTWFRAEKEAQGHKVVQFERLVGEVTSFVASAYLQVERSGPEGRFMPVKTPQDIDTVRPLVKARFGL